MSIANLLFVKKAGKIGNIQLDVTISESHLFSSTITKFPVEDGSDKTDHIINEPVALSISGFITNTPTKPFGDLVGRVVRKEKFNRVKSNFDALLELRNSKLPFTVVTGLNVYKNHFFQSLTIPRDAKTGDALRFTAVTIPIITVEAKSVKLKDVSEKYKDIGQSSINKGSQNKAAVAPGIKLESAAYKLGRFFKGIF